MPLSNFFYLLNTEVSEICTRESAPSRGSSMQRKDGNLSKRASSPAQRGRMGDAVALLPVCRSPPFAPCQQLSPYAPQISRRQLANLIMVAAALPAFSRIARAETYPSRPVRIIVGFPPGGAADVTARLICQWLSERLGQPFIIENLSGAGTNIGTEAVAKSPADGYTLLLVSVANTVNATLYETLNFDFIRDITPVAGLGGGPRGGGQSISPRPPRPPIHRLCQSQSRHNQHCVSRHRNPRPHGQRAVP